MHLPFQVEAAAVALACPHPLDPGLALRVVFKTPAAALSSTPLAEQQRRDVAAARAAALQAGCP